MPECAGYCFKRLIHGLREEMISMKIHYPNTNLQFTMESVRVDVQNIIFERLTRIIPTHSHGSGCYEIHYIPSGYGKLKANGADYDIRPNTLYVTGPHVEHAQTPLLSDPMEEYCVYLKLRGTPLSSGKSPVLSLFSETPFWFGQDTQQVSDVILSLFRELEHRYTGYKLQAQALLSQMIVCLVRGYEQHRNVSGGTALPPAKAKSILIEEYFLYEYQSLSLETLADRLGLGTRQTQRLLLEYYGKTFQQKKAEARMSAAAILLEDRERSITSVASLLGYSSLEHFSSAFRSYYRMSPREYRKCSGSAQASPSQIL